ncbi:MAG: leucyl aminopeptidase family protein, partial [Pyramidobacter sp.]|nr:leucyl aminopeptidase family protein [Pyramidobacter sp.]
ELIGKIGDALVSAKVADVWLDGWRNVCGDDLSEAEAARQIAAALPLCGYRFDRYLSKKASPAPALARMSGDAAIQACLDEGACLAGAVMTARDLINDIAESMTPQKLADEAVRLGRVHGFETRVLEAEACRTLGMNLFLAVSRGSALPPKLIVMRWNGGAAGDRPIALVGKGITYDSGGLHIKTSGMESMHYDMNGGGSVIGAMCAIAAQKLAVNVVGVVAACENMVDAKSYRNGDIITSMSGKTVYVRNTDAEGRLTMADAITYCVREINAREIIEVAGLTGSVCNFFGTVCAAALTQSQWMFNRVASLSPITGEKFWQMPTFPEYEKLLKWPFADLNNAPEGSCAGITAGLFLNAFREGAPFIHIDYGAMPFTKKDGANGFGVRTLYEYVKSRAMEGAV